MNMHTNDLEDFEKDWLEEARSAADALRQRRSKCPPIQLICAAAEALLDEDLQPAVAAHIAACASCRKLQADLRDLPASEDVTPQDANRILSRISRQERTAASRTKPGRIFWWRASIVTAGLALGVALIVWQVHKPGSVQAPSPGPAAVVRQTPAAVLGATALALHKPEVKFTLAVLTWRGIDNRRDEFLKEIAPALDAYRADKFADATAQLSALSAKYADSVEVWFYLGVSRLFLSDHSDAIEALEKAARLQDKSFAADISWYLGLAYHYSHRTREAHALFSKLCREDGEYAARGCAAAKELSSALQLSR